MMEDRLTREQRIRLEALAQAIASDRGRQYSDLIERAKVFESYIEGAEDRKTILEKAANGAMRARAILEEEGYTKAQAHDLLRLLQNKGIQIFYPNEERL